MPGLAVVGHSQTGSHLGEGGQEELVFFGQGGVVALLCAQTCSQALRTGGVLQGHMPEVARWALETHLRVQGWVCSSLVQRCLRLCTCGMGTALNTVLQKA